jgi:hypothetical protein
LTKADARPKEARMYLSRFNHVAAREAAVEHAKALHAERLRMSLAGLFGEGVDRREIERRVTELELREKALLGFIDDPYAAESLRQIFDDGDRQIVIDAGARRAGGDLAARAA